MTDSTFQVRKLARAVELSAAQASYGHPTKELSLQYMLLIYEDEAAEAARSEEEQRASIDAHIALAARLRAEGRFIAGDPLQPSPTATTVRLDGESQSRGGKVVITDGPYADTKEQLGGFYIVEAGDLDQALADAAAIPSIGWGVIEVRPLLDLAGN